MDSVSLTDQGRQNVGLVFKESSDMSEWSLCLMLISSTCLGRTGGLSPTRPSHPPWFETKGFRAAPTSLPCMALTAPCAAASVTADHWPPRPLMLGAGAC